MTPASQTSRGGIPPPTPFWRHSVAKEATRQRQNDWGARVAREHDDMSRISHRVAAITESATLAVDAKAKALQAAGEDVIGFGAGEPDFPTPALIVEAAIVACRNIADHHYTPAGGLPELRAAIAEKTARDSGYVVEPSQVVVTNGGKHAVYNTFETLLDPGDEVLLPAPYWTTYPESIDAVGRRPRRPPDHGRGRVPGHGRPTRRRVHAAHQGAAVRVAEQPDRRGVPAGRGRGHRALGGRARRLGGHRRDLRTPHVRRPPVLVHADARSRSRRHVRRAERRRQDVRDDGLARRVARSRPPTSARPR